MIYIVITAVSSGDTNYIIDSVWTSERKANKRCSELNAKSNNELYVTAYEVVQKFISH